MSQKPKRFITVKRKGKKQAVPIMYNSRSRMTVAKVSRKSTSKKSLKPFTFNDFASKFMSPKGQYLFPDEREQLVKEGWKTIISSPYDYVNNPPVFSDIDYQTLSERDRVQVYLQGSRFQGMIENALDIYDKSVTLKVPVDKQEATELFVRYYDDINNGVDHAERPYNSLSIRYGNMSMLTAKLKDAITAEILLDGEVSVDKLQDRFGYKGDDFDIALDRTLQSNVELERRGNIIVNKKFLVSKTSGNERYVLRNLSRMVDVNQEGATARLHDGVVEFSKMNDDRTVMFDGVFTFKIDTSRFEEDKVYVMSGLYGGLSKDSSVSAVETVGSSANRDLMFRFKGRATKEEGRIYFNRKDEVDKMTERPRIRFSHKLAVTAKDLRRVVYPLRNGDYEDVIHVMVEGSSAKLVRNGLRGVANIEVPVSLISGSGDNAHSRYQVKYIRHAVDLVDDSKSHEPFPLLFSQDQPIKMSGIEGSGVKGDFWLAPSIDYD